jgi:hypothetical protein
MGEIRIKVVKVLKEDWIWRCEVGGWKKSGIKKVNFYQ